MKKKKIWWFDFCTDAVISEFLRWDVLTCDSRALAAKLNQVGIEAANDSCVRFEREVAIGDLIIAGNCDARVFLIGEMVGEAFHHPGKAQAWVQRAMHWHCVLPEASCDRMLIDTVRYAGAMTELNTECLVLVEACVGSNAANDDVALPCFEISLAPPAVAMPQIPILFQSPFAERILRDFRWREYLRANPDVAANCRSEGDALQHFMLQGYYERRIFDPERLRGFDAAFYRRQYPELDLRADDEAMIHYCYAGAYEGRLANAPEAWRVGMRFSEEIARDFRWSEYIAANPDVAVGGDDSDDDGSAAREHFFCQGYRERRIFDPSRIHGLDVGFYRERYPELGLQSDADAQCHYCYEGYYEYRLKNRDSAWLYDADLHVFQMGKVGSHTIAGALHDVYPGNVVHAHWLTDIAATYPGCEVPYSKLLIHPRERPVRVISASREIVSWALSGLFHYHAGLVETHQDAMDLIHERFWNQAQTGIRWFDHRYFCDLDIYAHTFDHEQGHTRIAHPDMDLLLYRIEDLSRLEAPVGAFLGVSDLRFSCKNAGSDKPYAEMFAWALRNFKLPGNLLSTLYDSPFMRFFYSDDERQRSYERWVRPD